MLSLSTPALPTPARRDLLLKALASANDAIREAYEQKTSVLCSIARLQRECPHEHRRAKAVDHRMVRYCEDCGKEFQ